jgi:leader peptidase (prepilin peptidase)/N-methyltransferase
MGWAGVLLAAVLGVAGALWLRSRRYRYHDDEVQRTLNPWWLPIAAVLGAVAGTPFYAGAPIPVAVTYVLALVWAGMLAFIDLEVRRLPDRLTLPAYPVAGVLLTVCAAYSSEWQALARAAACAGLAVAAFFLLVVISPGQAGLGWGDVKLAGVLAALLGWLSWSNALLGLLTGFVLGGVAAAVLLLARRVGRKSDLTFGPALILGAYLSALLLPSG